MLYQGFDFGYIKGFGNLYNPISRISEKVPQSSWGTFSRTANDRSDLVPKWVFSEIISIMYYIIPLRTWILLSQIFWTSDPRSRVLSIVFSGNHRVKNDVSVFQSQNNVSNSEKKIWVFVCLRESRLSTAGSWKVPEGVLRIKMKDSIRRIILPLFFLANK